MANNFKYLFIILFIGLLLVNSGSSFIFFKLKEEAAEASAKKAIKERRYTYDAICCFDLEKCALEWVEDDEIRVNGHYYDVLYTVQTNGHIWVYSIADENETNLLNWYAEVSKKETKNDSNVQDFALSIKWYYQQTVDLSFTQYLNLLINTAYLGAEKSPYCVVAYPPPEQRLVV